MAAGAASQTATTQSLREQGLDGTPLHGTVVIDNHCHIGPAPHFYQTIQRRRGHGAHHGPRGHGPGVRVFFHGYLARHARGERHQFGCRPAVPRPAPGIRRAGPP